MATIEDAGAPTRSEFEDAFLDLCACPDCPARSSTSGSPAMRSTPCLPPSRVIVELDGWAPSPGNGPFERDRDRDADTLAAGLPTVRITWPRFTRTRRLRRSDWRRSWLRGEARPEGRPSVRPRRRLDEMLAGILRDSGAHELRSRRGRGPPRRAGGRWSSVTARGRTRREWTFGEVADRSARLAGALAARGVQRGDVVMTLIGNRAEWVLTMVACFRIGAVALPCNEQLRAKDLRMRLDGGRSEADRGRSSATPASSAPPGRPARSC